MLLVRYRSVQVLSRYEGGHAERERSDIHQHRLRPAAQSPARHEVVRLIPDPSDVEPGHVHVSVIETESGGGTRRWNLVEFVRAVRLGERFYLREGSNSVEVEPTVCDRCFRVTISIPPARREG